MYAIVKTGGKQYRVEKGQTLLIERLPEDAGSTVALQPLLFRSDDTIFDADQLAKVKVEAKILGHERGEKLRVFKFKPKRGYRRRTGHRQELTRIEVTDIKLLSRRPAGSAAADKADKPAPAASKADKPAPAASKAPAAAKPAAARARAAKAKTEEASDGS